MFSSNKKILPVLAAFIVGMTGVAGYAVHAQSNTQGSVAGTATQTSVQDPQQLDGETADDARVQTSAQDPKQLDGETTDDTKVQTSAQDPQQLDGETADDTKVAGATESENGSADNGPDTNESDSTN